MRAPDKQRRRLTSPGFAQALFGILVTTLAWFGPWSWPAWPAIAVIEVVFTPTRPFVALSYAARAAVVVALMVVNVTSWALIALLLQRARERMWHRWGG